MSTDSADDLVLADLFSGCGGFSLGAHQAGFRVAAAFDNDSILSSSYKLNFPGTNFVPADVSRLSGKDIVEAAGGRLDGMFGGPPCQGFSDIGRRQKDDPRRELIGHFFRLVREAKPTFFIMENVRGLIYADSRNVLDLALTSVVADYSLLGPVILEASDFGAATRRPRLFVIGLRKDSAEAMRPTDLEAFKRPAATVREAIADLEDATSVDEVDDFDRWRITKRGRPSNYARGLRSKGGVFTGHRLTAHTPSVVKRFEVVSQGGVERIGRHPRLAWESQCPTLRAGTGSDRGSYQSVRPLHPEHPRVITVREAARLQGFPDRFLFHPTVWHSFRMIGNSVSPIMARAIFAAVRSKLELPVRVGSGQERWIA